MTNWLQPGAIVAGAVGGLGLLITAFSNLRAELKEEMKAGEARVNRRIDELKEEMKEMKEEMKAGEARVNRRIDEVKEEMREIRGLLIQALQLSPAAKP